MFKQIFICPKCGEVDDIEPVEIIDTERDDVWTEMVCNCGCSVDQKMVEGKPCYRAMTENEIETEMFWSHFSD